MNVADTPWLAQSSRWLARLVAGLVIPAIVAPVGLAQSTAGLEFRARDATTGYAVQATLTIRGAAEAQFGPIPIATAPDGRYSRQALPPGHYLVEITAPGYRSGRTHFFVESDVFMRLQLTLSRERPPQEYASDVFDDKLRAGFTLLHGFVVEEETGQPISNANVTARRTQAHTRTDVRGYFELYAPTKPREGPERMPPIEDLIVRAAGYRTKLMQSFMIPDGQDSGFNVELVRGSGVDEHDLTHKLMRN